MMNGLTEFSYYCRRCELEDCNSFHRCFVNFRNPIVARPSLKVSPLVKKKIAKYLQGEGIKILTPLYRIEFEIIAARCSYDDKTQGPWCWAFRHRLINEEHNRIIIDTGDGETDVHDIGSHYRASDLVKYPMEYDYFGLDIDISIKGKINRKDFMDKNIGRLANG